MGQGFPIGNDGKYLNGDSRYAVIKGTPDFFNNGTSGGGPTILVDGRIAGIDILNGANSVHIRGFDIQSDLAAYTVGQGASAIPLTEMTAVAVNSVQNFELAYNKLNNAAIGFGAIYGDVQNFNVNVHDNTFDTLGVGAGVIVADSQGTLTFSRNTIQNTAIGLVAAAVGLDPATPSVLNAQIKDNIVKGGGLGIETDPAFSLGGVKIQDLLPIDVGSLVGVQGLETPPEELPSVSALNVAAISLSGVGSATVNATITGNNIEDNILGIGAVGVGSNGSVNASIQNNTLTGGGLAALIGDLDFAGVTSETTVDGSGIGIWMLGLGGGKLNNAVIANNTITKHALGIGVLGLGEAQMNNGLIANNTISDSLLGIVIVGVGEDVTDFKPIEPVETPVVQMNNWTISGNRIKGNGVGQIVGELLPMLPPSDLLTALERVNIPDTGLAGILVVGVAPQIDPPLGVNPATPVVYTTEMNNYQIKDNVVENEFLGIGVVGVGENFFTFNSFIAEQALKMNNYSLTGNTIRGNLVGILVAGVSYVDMLNCNIGQNNLQENIIGVAAIGANWTDQSGLRIHDNTIVGGGLDDLSVALQPLADTNIIDDVDIVNLLKLPLPDTGAIGVVVLADYADANGVSIDHNTISKNLVGTLVVGFDESDINQLSIANNTINDSVMGIGVMAFDDTYINDSMIKDNVINDPALGIMLLNEDYSQMKNLAVSGNTINRSLMGITAASWEDAIMTDLVISGNAISGANNPAKVALLTAFLEGTDLMDEIEDVINQPWNPALFPASGLEGVVVAADGAGDTSVTIVGNRFSNEAVAGLVNLQKMTTVVPISYINNTSSDGHYYVEWASGSAYTLTQSGNTPSPVIEIP
jgi:hypothetical protein